MGSGDKQLHHSSPRMSSGLMNLGSSDSAPRAQALTPQIFSPMIHTSRLETTLNQGGTVPSGAQAPGQQAPSHWKWNLNVEYKPMANMLNLAFEALCITSLGHHDLDQLWRISLDDSAWRAHRERISNRMSNIVVVVSRCLLRFPRTILIAFGDRGDYSSGPTPHSPPPFPPFQVC